MYNDFCPNDAENLTFELAKPTQKNVEFLSKNYSLGYSQKDIENVLKNRFVIYAKCGGEICGFIGMHEEMSIGLLEVFEKFRRKNVATSLLHKAVEMAKRENIVPFCHIISSNEKSLNLHKKINATFCEDSVYWLS